MAYDKTLARRVETALAGRTDMTAKTMFGGIGYLLNGNMACGVHGDGLIVRLDSEAARQAFANPHVKPFDLTGRPMKGWVVVQASGLDEDAELQAWVEQAVAYAATLPPK